MNSRSSKSKSFSDKLPFWHFDQNTMVFNDGSLGCGFKIQGRDISCSSNSTINEFASSIENLINTVAEGTRIQFFYKLTPDVSGLIDQHKEASCDPRFPEITESRVSFLRGLQSSGQFFRPECFVFVRSQPFTQKARRLFDKGKPFEQSAFDAYEKNTLKAKRLFKQVESSLSGSGLVPKHLSEHEWFSLIFEQLNKSRIDRIGLPKLRPIDDLFGASLNSQLCLSDIEVSRDGIKIDDFHYRTITMKLLPEGATFAGMMESFLKLPFHFSLTQNIKVLDQKKEMEKLQLERRITNSMARGSKNVADLESESKLEHLEELTRELLEGSEKLVSSDFNIMIWGRTLEELEEKTDEVLRTFKSLNQAEGTAETYAGIEAFQSCVAGTCAGLRMKKMKTSNAVHLAPVFGYWLGNHSPVCLISNRDQGLVSIDPFAPELPNWNGLVVGGSGSGKSFAISQLMLMFQGAKPKPKIVWIDNGASSKGLIDVMDGEFIELHLNSPICLNVFDLEPGQERPSPARVKLILAVLETILKDDDAPGLPKREKALLEESIFDVYDRCDGRTPTLSDLRNGLKEHTVAQMRNYAQVLFSWTGDRPFGKLLDGPSNVKLTKDLTTIEVKGLDSEPQLQNVFLLLLTALIRDEAARDINQPYVLIIDEAWKLFQTPSGRTFAAEAYRTGRKFKWSIIAVSQNYKDYLANPDIADAILTNTTHFFLLRQRGVDWNDLKDKLGLNSAEVELLKGLRSIKGKYSEVFYIQDENRSVLRIVPDPLSYWICTSDPKDKHVIAESEKVNPEQTRLEVLLSIVKDQESGEKPPSPVLSG